MLLGGNGDHMKKLIVSLFSIYILILSAILIFPAAVTAADEYVFGTNIRINDDTGVKSQKTPDIAVTANGYVYVVWGDERNDNSDIFISKSTDDGRLFGDQLEDNDKRVDNGGTASQREPAIAVFMNDIYVVWMDDRPPVNVYHIYIAKSTDYAVTFTGNIRVDSLQSQTICEYPDVAVSPADGKISVVWQADDRIYYSESSDGGSTFSSDVIVDNTGPSGSVQKYPKIAVGNNGDKYVVWQDNRSGGADYDIYFAYAGSGSTTFGGITRLDSGTAGSKAQRPAITASGNSDVYVVWKDERDATSGDIYFIKSTDKGSTWGTDIKVESTNKGAFVQDRPAIAVDSSGNIHVAWEDKRNPDYQIYYANSTDGGNTFNTNFRVDDGTQNINCHEPAIAVKGTNKVFIGWKDARNTDTDVYFSKWGIKGQMGYPPILKDIKLTPAIGGLNAPYNEFKWEVTYIDLDNEGPEVGYPKLHIYTDHSKTTEIIGSPITMGENYGQTNPYSSGRLFSITKKLTEVHDYAYLIEVKAMAGDTTLVKSDLKFGPQIDNTPPVYSDSLPLAGKWLNTKSVECSISITDVGGSGVDNTRTQYKYKTNGSDEFSRFYTNAKLNPIPGGYRCSTTITFEEGADNYIIWNTTDLVKSGDVGYALSNAYEVKVDTTSVSFTDPVPLSENWQNKEAVTCSITIKDLGGSGVNGSSIKYYYLPSGTANYIGPNSAAVNKIDTNIIATTPTSVPFNNGVGNYIKWEAMDVAGNNMISEAFEINIDTSRPDNTPPKAPANLRPANTNDKTPTIEWDKSYDADSDDLTYFIRMGTYKDGSDLFDWISTGSNNYYIIKTDLLVGTYYIQVRAFDDWDYSPIVKRTMNITATSTNTLPSSPTSILPDVSTYDQPQIQWSGAQDKDNDTLLYYVQIGRLPGSDDVLKWTATGKNTYFTPQVVLSDGIYYVQIMSYDGIGTSAPYSEILKIASFQPELEIPIEHSAVQGELSVTVKLKLINNGTMSDNITVNVTGELTTKTGVEVKLKPDSPILLDVNQTKTLTLTITLPPQITIGDYVLEFQATSEDGETTSFQHSLVIHVIRKKPDNNGGANGDDNGTESPFDLGNLLPLIILLIIVIVIIVVIAGIVSYSKKKKHTQKAKDEFYKQQDEYEKLYGPKGKY